MLCGTEWILQILIRKDVIFVIIRDSIVGVVIIKKTVFEKVTI